MKLITFVQLATAAVAQMLPARWMQTASFNVTNIVNVHLAEGAVQIMQNHSLWVPDVNNLTEVATDLKGNFTQLAIYLNSIVDMKKEVEKYSKSLLSLPDPFDRIE